MQEILSDNPLWKHPQAGQEKYCSLTLILASLVKLFMIQSSCLTILLIDDLTAEWMNFHQYLRQDSIYTYKILQFETGKQAIVWCQQQRADVILLNSLLPDGNGLELLRKLRESSSNTQLAIILLTEHEDTGIAVQAMKNGAQDYLVKNQLTPATLHAAIHDALKHRHEIWQLEQSRSQQQLITALTQAAPVAIFQINTSGNCIYASDYWSQITGRATDTALGTEWVETLHPEDRDRILTQWREWYESYQPGQIYDNEGRFLHQDGSITWFYCQIVAETNEEGKIIGYIGTLTDISKRKQAEAQLYQINQKLAQANLELARATRRKDEFLANMSHELRTPLNVILGMSEAFNEAVLGEINQQQAQAIATIERSGRHLLELINDILDLAKIESGKLELQLSHSSINSLCHKSLLFVQQLALNKNIRLITDIAESLGNMQADERRLCQVLINLLSNAIKFTPAGGVVTLKVWLEAAEGENPTSEASSVPHINFSVSDTGIGIAAEDIQKLFQPFIQLDNSLNRQFNGTGLGLVLVQQITTLHGGTISVTSQVGEGSCFTVRIPYISSDRSSITLQEVQSPITEVSSAINVISNTSALILLVEDNPGNVTTMANYLQHRGYRLAIANNGSQAIEQTYTQHPHLILMDIQMPEMDGLQAIQRIRNDKQFDCVPIIALTALAMPGDREICLAAGANEYLTKPVRLQHLIAKIQQLLTS